MLLNRWLRRSVIILVLGLAWTAPVQAQVRIITFNGSNSGFYYPYSGMGRWGGNYQTWNYANTGYRGGYNMPYYGGMNYGSAYGGFVSPSYVGYSGPVNLPGWLASGRDGTSAYMRSTLAPAVGVPANSPLLQVGSFSTGGATGTSATGTRTEVMVSVPCASAKVWFDGVILGQTGNSRRFFTPPLEAGKEYVYDVQAQWTDGQGQVQTAKQSITFRAGDVVPVNFAQ